MNKTRAAGPGSERADVLIQSAKKSLEVTRHGTHAHIQCGGLWSEYQSVQSVLPTGDGRVHLYSTHTHAQFTNTDISWQSHFTDGEGGTPTPTQHGRISVSLIPVLLTILFNTVILLITWQHGNNSAPTFLKLNRDAHWMFKHCWYVSKLFIVQLWLKSTHIIPHIWTSTF